jgi:hypothetical protein
MINRARQENNLPAVSLNNTLNETAGYKIDDMLANNYFEHTSPGGVTPWFWFKKAGYNYAYAGENLAIDFVETKDVFSAWMASPAHRDNILSPNFNEIGLAVKSGLLRDHNATLAVLVFGKQFNNQKQAIPVLIPAPATSLPAPVIPKTVKQTTPTPSAIPSPSSSPSAVPSVSPNPALAGEENIELKSIAGETTRQSNTNSLKQTKLLRSLSSSANKWTPRVLGAFASKTEEATKSFYLYFTLFLTLALIINIFIKIEIQYWQTIFSTSLVVLLSSILIFI